MKRQKIDEIKILGVKVNLVDFQKTLDIIEHFIQKNKPHQIVTVNPEFIIAAQKDEESRRVLNQAELAVPDGIGVIWASKLFKKPLKERVTGVDLVERLAELASKKGYSVYFLGGEEGVARKASQMLKSRYPKLRVAGYRAGRPYDLDLIPQIKKTKPDILFVAWGFPKQDKWIAKYKARLGIPVCIGVGGSFDFISKKVPRAPLWLRNLGLEWLYRLIRQPWRIKRQLALPKFVYLVLRKYLTKKDA